MYTPAIPAHSFIFFKLWYVGSQTASIHQTLILSLWPDYTQLSDGEMACIHVLFFSVIYSKFIMTLGLGFRLLYLWCYLSADYSLKHSVVILIMILLISNKPFFIVLQFI